MFNLEQDDVKNNLMKSRVKINCWYINYMEDTDKELILSAINYRYLVVITNKGFLPTSGDGHYAS